MVNPCFQNSCAHAAAAWAAWTSLGAIIKRQTSHRAAVSRPAPPPPATSNSNPLPRLKDPKSFNLGSFRKNVVASPPLLRRLPKAHAWSATVLVDELDPGGLQSGSKGPTFRQ
jgi:hypothetical protein